MKPPEENTAAENANSEDESTSSGHSVLSLIRGIQSGQIPPKSLSIEDRRRCVEHLGGEGYSTAETAEILKTIERTVSRDRRAIREANAVEADPGFIKEMIGRLVMEAELAIARIRRVTRHKDTSPIAKIEGERACWVIIRELVEALQRLGCLPTAPQEIRGDLTHHLAEPPAMAAIRDELQRVMEIQRREAADDGAVLESLSGVKSILNTLEAAQPDDAPDGAPDKEPIHGNAQRES